VQTSELRPSVQGDSRPETLEPSVARRLLRAELRKWRQAAGLTQQQAAKGVAWSPSKLIRFETGAAVVASLSDVKVLSGHYGVSPEETEELLALARAARKRSWVEVLGLGRRAIDICNLVQSLFVEILELTAMGVQQLFALLSYDLHHRNVVRLIALIHTVDSPPCSRDIDGDPRKTRGPDLGDFRLREGLAAS
jgi:transcriptional regulator with XRE-family HTH domain